MLGKVGRIAAAFLLLILLTVVYQIGVAFLETAGVIPEGSGLFDVIDRLFGTAIIIGIAVIASNFLTAVVFVDVGIGRFFPMKIVPLVEVIVRASVWLIALNQLIMTWSGSTSGLLGLLGVLGIGLAFAGSLLVQSIFGFARVIGSEMFIIGDDITVNRVSGKVVDIGLLDTRLSAAEGDVTVPNSLFLRNIVVRHLAESQPAE